jgi:hypothetical protein
MKNTRFTHPEHGPVGLATCSVTLTGYDPMRSWVLVPMAIYAGGVWGMAYPTRRIPLHYAGTRAEVAEALLQSGCERVV